MGFGTTRRDAVETRSHASHASARVARSTVSFLRVLILIGRLLFSGWVRNEAAATKPLQPPAGELNHLSARRTRFLRELLLGGITSINLGGSYGYLSNEINSSRSKMRSSPLNTRIRAVTSPTSVSGL